MPNAVIADSFCIIGKQDCALDLEFPVVSTIAILSKASEKGLLAG